MGLLISLVHPGKYFRIWLLHLTNLVLLPLCFLCVRLLSPKAITCSRTIGWLLRYLEHCDFFYGLFRALKVIDQFSLVAPGREPHMVSWTLDFVEVLLLYCSSFVLGLGPATSVDEPLDSLNTNIDRVRHIYIKNRYAIWVWNSSF